MLSSEQEGQLHELARRVMRAFYEPKFIIAMDQLIRHPVMRDDTLASRMGLQLKEVNKLMAVLEKDRLVQVHRQNELKDGAQRSVGRQYFYLDFRHFCDVVKWRMAEMRNIIDSRLRNELDNQGYICGQCKKQFTPLEVDKLIDFSRGVFVCDVCHGVVDNNEDDENVRGSQDRMQRFNDQMFKILDCLRKSEDMTMPKFDVSARIAAQFAEQADAQNGDGEPGGGLKIAGQSGQRTQDTGVGVVITVDKDPETLRREREEAAAARRQQNQLPEWHLKSTITGALTALGVKESAREAENNHALRMQGDEALVGLGRAGPSTPIGGENGGAFDALAMNGEADVKPVIRNEPEVDLYDQYYASLAASAAPTPFSASVSTPNDDETPSQLEDQSSRKRSRSIEDEGEAARKHGRFDDAGGDAKGDDPIVYVNGEPMAFSRVTEEDHERMTPEEYSAYFEIMQTQSFL